MVRTRHNRDLEDESVETFDSLESRSSARRRKDALKENEDSDDSGVINFNKKGANKAENKAPIKRESRSTAKRVTYVEDYLDESDSDIEIKPARRVGRPPKAIHDDEDNDIQIDTEATSGEEDTTPGYSTRKKRAGSPHSPISTGLGTAFSMSTKAQGKSISPKGRGRSRLVQDDDEEDGDDEEDDKCVGMLRRTRRRADYNTSDRESKQRKLEVLSEHEDGCMRRSSRTRKTLYGTYNQDEIINGYGLDDQPPRKRAPRDVHLEDNEEGSNEYTDIYSRVKRQRKQVKRDMYGMPIETDNEENEDDGDHKEEDDNQDSSGDDDNEDNDDEEDDEEDYDDDQTSPQKARRSYNLRENKPRTQLYIAPVAEKRRRNNTRFLADEISASRSPARRRRVEKLGYLSPARKHSLGRGHKRRAFHGSSSTSSSSESSSDEEKFQRRKAKSMMKARQNLLPMNFESDDIMKSSLLRDRQKIGSSLADVDPMTIDKTVTFDSVGGLGKHVQALKEMVVFPLMYPEIFERFKITPPRGVLFYGPPGTGKTLVARALANECSTDGRRVAFYMRKGADCLSKWVGESERQLRLLFDQAYQTRPSIIFFDEIDGLAPVRSSRQDQIHSSIVSTLLALMDGLDSRGEIVVIGATNRLDSIDPALRRPGRFDREFLFPLPSIQARKQILKIHTKEWNPRLCDKFVAEVAEKCTGYCGADMNALCTEVALLALRRRYPQIYTSSEKLQIDVQSVNVNAKDFHNAMQLIVPASQRSVTSPARALSPQVAPLMSGLLSRALTMLNDLFPSVLMQLQNLDAPATEASAGNGGGTSLTITELDSDDDERNACIFEQKIDKRRKQSNIPELPETFLNIARYADRHPSTHRPRFLLAGSQDQGQTSHLAPALLHHLEQLPVHKLDLSALYAVSARTPEESCAHIFCEARRTAPSIVYLPHVNQWWDVVGETVRSTIVTLIHDLDPNSPVLLLATSEEKFESLDFNLQDLFDQFCGEVLEMWNPGRQERRDFFKDLLLNQATRPPTQRKVAAERLLEVLPKAPPPEPRKLTENELRKLHEHEGATLTELRLFLRDVLNKLGRDRKFFIFTKPVDIDDVPDYYEIIKKPMDLSTMMSKIDLHQYQSVQEFLGDIDLICLNALEYNPDKDPQSRVIRHRACALKDTTNAIIKAELDPEFEKICLGIMESRKQRGEEGKASVLPFYHTRPLGQGQVHSDTSARQSTSQDNSTRDSNLRPTRKHRGAILEELPSLEEVERNARAHRSLLRQQNSPKKVENDQATPRDQLKKNTPSSRDFSGKERSLSSQSSGKKSSPHKTPSSSSIKKPAKKDIWGSGSYKSRKRRFKRRRIDSDNENDDVEDDMVELPNGEDDDNEDGTNIDYDNNVDMEEESESVNNRSPDHGNRRQEAKDNDHGDKDNGTSLLSIDVQDTNSKDNKSPQHSPRASQRSPRSEGQRSPRGRLQASEPSSGLDSKRRISADSRSKSPRCSDQTLCQDNQSKESAGTVRSPLGIKCNKQSSVDSGDSGVHSEIISSSQGKPLAQNHLLNGFVDSGIGTSDSSNDSVGKIRAVGTSKAEESSKSLVVVTEPMEEDSHTETQTPANAPSSPVFHLTRARVQTKAQEHAATVISELQQPLVIDRERLVRLLDRCVELTEEYTVPMLEKLYSLFGQCIYQQRLEYNKTPLLEDMEQKLVRFTNGMSQRMKLHKSRALS
ncbi:ATPase family AAA domain-containing protein 2-like isoform X2 [Dreissena polymorpha]|uniref:ATPase family AAA domain-containing protein 2-like isoform X2 n=1 Tax=Dreissena polymorpha TaxID=45954 RepID=UPI002263C16D|nr:ATPase family AAA domain-containing protein 2-like isoform X2 [Dreissena polymorpha]